MIGIENVKPSKASEPETPLLAMRSREAAKALGISERLLWEWTDKGVIPHIRIGKAIRYPVDSLRDWLRREAEQGIKKADEKNFEKSQNIP